MHQRRHPAKTARGSSIAKRLFGTFYAPARPPTKNSERVVNSADFSGRSTRQRSRDAIDAEKTSQNAACASVANRGKQRDGRRFPFARSSMRQRGHPPKQQFTLKIRTAPQQSISTRTIPTEDSPATENSHCATARAF